MLTEADKKWLEKRKPPTEKPCDTTADDNFCKHCKQYDIDCVPWFRNTGDCPTHRGGDYRDAAEFEARVAVMLAEKYGAWDFCFYSYCATGTDTVPDCVASLLKEARLVVEEEMEEK